MDFGTWLRRTRKRNHLDLSAVADRSGVDISTLSRIENNRTQPTLETVIRICDGFGMDMTQLLRQLVGDDALDQVRPSERQTDMRQPVLKLDDMRRFYRYFSRHTREACDLIAAFLQTATDTELRTRANWENARYRRFSLHDYEGDHILRLLLAEPIYHIELAYPSDFDAHQVLLTYQNNGVLTFSDVGIYIRGQRRSKKQTLAGIEKTVNRSASVLSRIEGGVLGRIKLSAALELDQELGTTNEILGMFWDAAQFQSLSRRTVQLGDDEISLLDAGTALITVLRWHQVQQPGSSEWLAQFRSALDAANLPPEA